MNIRYCQPEANQTGLSRKARGAQLELERLASQIEATIKRAIALAALLTGSACAGVAPEHITPVDAGTCDTGTWTVRADYAYPPDMWAGADVRCVLTQDLPVEQAALWTCVDACSPVTQ